MINTAETLYELTMSEALQESITRLEESHPELTKKEAKKLVMNALIYNCVIDEVVGQAEFLYLGSSAGESDSWY